jgi:serine protease Do
MRSKLSKNTRLVLVIGLTAIAAVLGFQFGSFAAEKHPQVIAAQERPIGSLRDLNRAFVDIAAAVKPAVVTVSTEKTMTAHGMNPFAGDPFSFFFGPQQQQPQQPQREYRQQGLGSGVIVSADGRVLTNNHVIADVDSIVVRTFTGERYKAKLIGADPKTDIAVLQIDAKDLPFVEIGNSDSLQVGEMVLAIGSPMSENLAYTVTQGIVSAKGRSNVGLADYEDFIQTDAAINPGNSGGPLINLDGQVIGINSAIASRTGGFEGIGFAIPSNMALKVMESLVADGRVVRGWLGVSIQDLTPNIAKGLGLDETGGALVGQVESETPAEKAGIEAGDIVVSLDGQKIENSTQLRNRIGASKPGAKVTLGVLRGDEKKDIDVTLGELPGESAPTADAKNVEDRLGFSVTSLTPNLARQYDLDSRLTGVVVTSLDQQSGAAEAGLREGDLIRGVYRKSVASEDEFYAAVKQVPSGETVLLRVFRDGGGFYIAFKMN